MKVLCEVTTQNRLLAVHSGRSQVRTRASVVLGKKNTKSVDEKAGTVFLLVCTAKDKNGTKYKVQGNILHIFSKFVHEGKATIRLKEPPFDLCLSKADPSALKKLLTILKLDERQFQQVNFSSLAPVKASDIEKPKTELNIKQRKDYPINKSFPVSLQKLSVTECALRRIDPRIFQLKHLTSLNLTGNSITTLPKSFLRLQALSQLILTDNKLSEFPPFLCCTSMSATLKTLDLSGNEIHLLPMSFCKMKALICLKLDRNGLLDLPPNIGGLNSLRYISASHNMMKTVPHSLRGLQLECVDFSGNPYIRQEECEVIKQNLEGVPKLLECAGRAVKKYRCAQSPGTVPVNLALYLDSSKQCCRCQGACFESYASVIEWINLHQLSHTVISGGLGTNSNIIPTDTFVCSLKCLQRWIRSKY